MILLICEIWIVVSCFVDVNQEGSSGVEATKTSGENNDAQGSGKSSKRKASTGGSKRKSSSRPSSSKKKK